MRVYSIADDIDKHWDWVLAELKVCQEHHVDPIDWISLREDVRARKSIIIVIEDDTERLAVSLVEFKENSLHVRLCSGKQMDKWITVLINVLIESAKVMNKKYITQLGRKGWARAMKQHGWEHQYSQYVRTV